MSIFEAISAAILSGETPVDVSCDCGHAPIGFIRPAALGEWEDSIREIIAHAQYSHVTPRTIQLIRLTNSIATS